LRATTHSGAKYRVFFSEGGQKNTFHIGGNRTVHMLIKISYQKSDTATQAANHDLPLTGTSKFRSINCQSQPLPTLGKMTQYFFSAMKYAIMSQRWRFLGLAATARSTFQIVLCALNQIRMAVRNRAKCARINRNRTHSFNPKN